MASGSSPTEGGPFSFRRAFANGFANCLCHNWGGLCTLLLFFHVIKSRHVVESSRGPVLRDGRHGRPRSNRAIVREKIGDLERSLWGDMHGRLISASVRRTINISVAVLLVMFLVMPAVAHAHSGRTDSHGGHRDRRNVSGLGPYHFHHGEAPHLHPGWVCPYDSPPPQKPDPNPYPFPRRKPDPKPSPPETRMPEEAPAPSTGDGFGGEALLVLAGGAAVWAFIKLRS